MANKIQGNSRSKATKQSEPDDSFDDIEPA